MPAGGSREISVVPTGASCSADGEEDVVAIQDLSVEEIIDHLCERCDWLAIVAKHGEYELSTIVHGSNGLEMLGGIYMLLRTHGEACHQVYTYRSVIQDGEDIVQTFSPTRN
jgi:hypothetical protein